MALIWVGFGGVLAGEGPDQARAVPIPGGEREGARASDDHAPSAHAVLGRYGLPPDGRWGSTGACPLHPYIHTSNIIVFVLLPHRK